MPFQSARFQGDPILEACLAGQHRMMAGQSGEAVRKVQQALIDLGYSIPDGATGTFGPQTAAAVVQFKRDKGLRPTDPVVGPGTSRHLDEDITLFDQGRYVPTPQAELAAMKAKFYYGGEGAKVPGTDFGLGAAIFQFFLRHGGEWRGYEVVTNAPLRGAAILESPNVDFRAKDDPVLANLHGQVVEVRIAPSLFVMDGGVASFVMSVKTNSGADPEIAFTTDGVKGFSALVDDSLSFTATLLQLPANQWDPDKCEFLPW